MENQVYHQSHKKHRNVLYALVFVLLVLQITSFLVASSQISNLQGQIAKNKADLEASMKAYDTSYQKNFNDISLSLTAQQKSFTEQLAFVKSQAGDFSGIIENAVKGVVSVGTDDALASGFVLTSDGYVVTNQHVIEGASVIQILTYDKQIIPVELIGADAVRDIALLKAQGSFYALPLGDSDSVQVGNKVIAIGNPLGLSFSVTEGIVSATNREGPSGLSEYVQTDVPLNPGNSGGPLIDKSGNVIGINNFKVGNTEGLGFALESDAIVNLVNSIANRTIIS